MGAWIADPLSDVAYGCDPPVHVTTNGRLPVARVVDCAVSRHSGRMHVDQARRPYTTVGGEPRSYPTYLLPAPTAKSRAGPEGDAGEPDWPAGGIDRRAAGHAERSHAGGCGGGVEVERSVPHGNVAAAHVMASKLGLRELLARDGQEQRPSGPGHRPPRRGDRAADRPGRQAAQPDQAPACGASPWRGGGPPGHIRRPGGQRVRPGDLAAGIVARRGH